MSGAAAEILLHAFKDAGAREFGILQQQRIGVHYHAGRAEAALDGAKVDKSLLQRMKRVAFCQSLDRRNRCAANILDGHRAGTPGLFFYDHRARSAKTSTAAVFRARQPQIRSQNPKQFPVGLNIQCHRFSVQPKTDGFFHSLSRLSRLDYVLIVSECGYFSADYSVAAFFAREGEPAFDEPSILEQRLTIG